VTIVGRSRFAVCTRALAHSRFCAGSIWTSNGETNIVIGGSGQGKSVLMKHLMGLLQPDSGHIYVDGEDIVGLDDVAIAKIQRKFGMVFSTRRSSIRSTWSRHRLPAHRRYRLPRSEILARVRDLLRRLDLDNVPGVERSSSRASGGMRKRVDWLARWSTGSDFALR